MTSQRTTVSVTGMDEADITGLWELREREKKALQAKGIHLTFLPFFIKAVQHSLAEHPMLNASVDEEKEEIIVKKYYNIGVAVDTPEGLMVPVIRDAGRKTILELAADLQELSRKARERKITLEEMKGSTFTITNYGHFGGTFATPVINYPDVAILGTGRISDKPWVKDGQIVIRKILPLSLTFDHRVTDGVDASLFLTKVIRLSRRPRPVVYRERMSSLERLFSPGSIALIGASHDETKLGGIILKNLLQFKGKVYPVNPKYREIMGLKAYPSAADIPGQCDLTIIMRPAPEVPEILQRTSRQDQVRGDHELGFR